MVVFHLSKIYSTGCAGGRCRRRARPGKGAEGRLLLRVLSYYITGNSYCKVKFYVLYRFSGFFASAGQKNTAHSCGRRAGAERDAAPARQPALRRGQAAIPPSRLRLERRNRGPHGRPQAGEKAVRSRRSGGSPARGPAEKAPDDALSVSPVEFAARFRAANF